MTAPHTDTPMHTRAPNIPGAPGEPAAAVAAGGDWPGPGFLEGWAEAAFDPATGRFCAFLDQAGRPLGAQPWPFLTQARLVYAFGRVALRGGAAWARQAAARACAALEDYRAPLPGAWFSRIGADGRRDESRIDAYDLAFALLAWATWLRLTGEPRARDEMEHCYGVFDRHLRDRAAGGFFEALGPDRAPLAEMRRQNPHMHLLEACLAAFEATGEARWADRAAEIEGWLHRFLLDPRTGTLAEFLGDDLGPRSDGHGRIREPGHHFEWTWLLLRHARLTGSTTARAAAERLFGFACRHGFGPGGSPETGVLEAVDPGGAVLSARRLLWPQLEAAKADRIRIAAGLAPELPAVAGAVLRHVGRQHVMPGRLHFNNVCGADGAAAGDPAPTRMLYHLVSLGDAG